MNRYFCLLLVISSILYSCDRNAPLMFSSEILSEQDLAVCKNDPCSEVEILFQQATGEESVSSRINAAIKLQITDALFLGDEDPSLDVTIEAAAAQFVLAYRDHQPDIPSDLDNGGYQASINMTLLLQNDDLVSIQNDTYIYTGGAHGNGYTTFLNFDVQTGKQMDVEELVSDFEAFEAFAEKKFRETQDIQPEESINETGFMFDDEQFYVSTNVGISNEEMVIVYNPFEISPTAKGIVILRIPIEEVQPYLNDNLL